MDGDENQYNHVTLQNFCDNIAQQIDDFVSKAVAAEIAKSKPAIQYILPHNRATQDCRQLLRHILYASKGLTLTRQEWRTLVMAAERLGAPVGELLVETFTEQKTEREQPALQTIDKINSSHWLWFVGGVCFMGAVASVFSSLTERNKPIREGIARLFRASMGWMELPVILERSLWLLVLGGLTGLGVWAWYRVRMSKGLKHVE